MTATVLLPTCEYDASEVGHVLNSSNGSSDDNHNSRWTALKDCIVTSKVYQILSWTPPNCRWNPEHPPRFSLGLNILFGFAGAFTVANLYYNHPILNILAHDFHVTYEQVSAIPTLMQAGYATGLLLLAPLGDLFKRRPFVLILIFTTATFWYGYPALLSSSVDILLGSVFVSPRISQLSAHCHSSSPSLLSLHNSCSL